jgi:putative zinc finger/helix-turn-helix YgiT family protein
VCERGELSPVTVTESIRYNDALLSVAGIELSRCDACEEEVALPEQARANERRFADAKRRHDALLTSDEIVQWRKELGWTQAQAAALLGGGANAFSKYERGEVIQSRAMDLLLRVLRAVPEARAMVEDLAHGVVKHTLRRPIRSRTLDLSAWQVDEDAAVLPVNVRPLHRVAANEAQRAIRLAEHAYG